jgi:ribosomal protein S18 acetylase RimI-like enzyme
MVHDDFRGRGIAHQMVADLLTGAREAYSDVVIRVWDRNEPALSLYRKLGFQPVASIRQTKLMAPSNPFEMKKIYLHRSIG